MRNESHAAEAVMKGGESSSLFDAFRSADVEGIEVAIRRSDDGGLKVTVACSSTRGRMFEHEGTCSDGDCEGVLEGMIREALLVATGAPPEVRRFAAPPHASGVIAKLSEREREILRHIAEGDSNKLIATKLGISVHTVNAHRVSIMAKTDVHDAQGLTRLAAQHGLIDVRRSR